MMHALTTTSLLLSWMAGASPHELSHQPSNLRSTAGAAAIFWQSDPVRPNQTVILSGEGLDRASQVLVLEIRTRKNWPDATTSWARIATSVPILQSSTQSLKFIIPAHFRTGLYAYQLAVGREQYLVGVLNRPDAWWAQGTPGESLTPGQPVRVFGRNLGWETPQGKSRTHIALDGPRSLVLPAVADEYSARATLPVDLPAGKYRLAVHNGVGGATCWSEPLTVVVQQAAAWPTTVFDVRRFGARGTGTDDDTQAVQAAISAASKQGGVVYFPRGRYLIDGTLALPKRTALRGEDIALVNLVWRDSATPPQAFVEGEGQFALEDLTIYVSNHHNVIRSTSLVGDVRMHSVRIRANPLISHLKLEDVAARLKRTSLEQSAVALGGPGIEVTDCDIYSGNSSLFLTNAVGATVSGNHLHNGFAGGYFISSGRSIVFEGNEISGASLSATGGGINNWGATASEHIYFARNSLSLMFYGDREGMTTDSSGNAFFGNVTKVLGTVLTLGPNQHREAQPSRGWVGEGVFIVSGRGSGQYRRVKALTGDRLEIDQPWTVEPDRGSLVSVTHLMRQMLFVGNRFTDCGIALQFYGSTVDFVAARNTSTRTAGFHSFGMDYHGIQPNWYVQFLGNSVLEGNCYRCGHDSVLFSGEAHVGVYQFPLTYVPAAYSGLSLARACVLRSNVLKSDAIIQVGGTDNADKGGDGHNNVTDVVVEFNNVARSSRGISVRQPAHGIVVRENQYTDVHTERTAE